LAHARELQGHLTWLESFSGAALAVLATASGIYTYLGVSSLLDDTGALSFFAASAYSIAVSVGIFVFWSYLMRLMPAMRTAGAKLKLMGAMLLGSVAIIAMSSWLNAAALAGAAAVEQHLAQTVQEYQEALEQAHDTAVSAQALERDVARVRQSFQDLSEQEASGDLSGLAGRGAVFRVLRQKAEELAALEVQIQSQTPLIDGAFEEGNAILSRMRALIVEPGAVEARSVAFSEDAVRLAGLVSSLRQLSVAPLVDRAAEDLSASVVLPELDSATTGGQEAQASTISSVLQVLALRAASLEEAAEQVLARPAARQVSYTPISSADAVILYARNFVPSWAGAIAIDLLPAVLVLILMVTQGAIRAGRGDLPAEDSLTLAELRSALHAMREMEALDRPAAGADAARAAPSENVKPLAPQPVRGHE
jgi:translation initiation factor 2B subunit (eIF-2B alpha/beta/delta family)